MAVTSSVQFEEIMELCEINAVSGNEQAMRRYLLKKLEGISGVSARIDRCGNVICEKESSTPGTKNVLVTAPMDEVGMIVTGYSGSFLRISPVGKADSRMAVSKRVEVGSGIKGVIGSKPIHLQSSGERKRKLDWDDLYCDIGAKDEKEASSAAPKGTYISFDSPCTMYGEDMITGKALDGRVCVYNLLRLIEWCPDDVNLTAAFTTLRESSMRGAGRVVFGFTPDMAIALSASIANDLTSEENEQVSCCGGGAVILFADKDNISTRELYRTAVQKAEETGKQYQLQRGISPDSGMGAVQHSFAPVPALALAVPCRMMHSPLECVSVHDVDSQLELAKMLLG